MKSGKNIVIITNHERKIVPAEQLAKLLNIVVPFEIGIEVEIPAGKLCASTDSFPGDESVSDCIRNGNSRFNGIDVAWEEANTGSRNLISRVEQPIEDGDVGEVRNYLYDKDDPYIGYVPIRNSSESGFSPIIVASGDKDMTVHVYKENQHVEYHGLIRD